MKKVILTLFLTLFLGAFSVRAVEAAAYLTVSPLSGNYSVNDTFTVTLGVNSGGEAVGGADGVGTYDSARLELVSITQASDMVFAAGSSGGGCAIDQSAGAGQFSYSCYSNDALTDVAVSGSLVTINFKAKATGTAILNYSCTTGSTIDSNIVKSSTVTDVITCSSNQSGSYVIGGESSSTDPTSIPTTVSSSTTELPQTGNFGMTLGLIAFGAVSLLSAVFLKFL